MDILDMRRAYRAEANPIMKMSAGEEYLAALEEIVKNPPAAPVAKIATRGDLWRKAASEAVQAHASELQGIISAIKKEATASFKDRASGKFNDIDQRKLAEAISDALSNLLRL